MNKTYNPIFIVIKSIDPGTDGDVDNKFNDKEIIFASNNINDVEDFLTDLILDKGEHYDEYEAYEITSNEPNPKICQILEGTIADLIINSIKFEEESERD